MPLRHTGNEDTTVGYDTVSIISKKNEITNPNVRYLVCDVDRRNGHNSLFYSLEALGYADEINEIGARIDEQYDYDAPEEVLRESYPTVVSSFPWRISTGVSVELMASTAVSPKVSPKVSFWLVLDLDAALTWVEGERRFDGVPVFLFGHSWGGYAVTAIFHFDHDIAASASVAGFNEAMPMIRSPP